MKGSDSNSCDINPEVLEHNNYMLVIKMLRAVDFTIACFLITPKQGTLARYKTIDFKTNGFLSYCIDTGNMSDYGYNKT